MSLILEKLKSVANLILLQYIIEFYSQIYVSIEKLAQLFAY